MNDHYAAATIGTKDDLVVGSGAICAFLEISPRQLFYAIKKGDVPGLFKNGGKLVLSKESHRLGIVERIEAARIESEFRKKAA